MVKTIRVSKDVHSKLVDLKEHLSKETGDRLSMNMIMRYLLNEKGISIRSFVYE